VNPDYPLSGASATIFPIEGEALARLRREFLHRLSGPTVATDPALRPRVEALGRAKPEVHAFFWRVLEEQAPAWLSARRAEVAALLPAP
jgi:hypothetical protein